MLHFIYKILEIICNILIFIIGMTIKDQRGTDLMILKEAQNIHHRPHESKILMFIFLLPYITMMLVYHITKQNWK